MSSVVKSSNELLKEQQFIEEIKAYQNFIEPNIKINDYKNYVNSIIRCIIINELPIENRRHVMKCLSNVANVIIEKQIGVIKLCLCDDVCDGMKIISILANAIDKAFSKFIDSKEFKKLGCDEKVEYLKSMLLIYCDNETDFIKFSNDSKIDSILYQLTFYNVSKLPRVVKYMKTIYGFLVEMTNEELQLFNEGLIVNARDQLSDIASRNVFNHYWFIEDNVIYLTPFDAISFFDRIARCGVDESYLTKNMKEHIIYIRCGWRDAEFMMCNFTRKIAKLYNIKITFLDIEPLNLDITNRVSSFETLIH